MLEGISVISGTYAELLRALNKEAFLKPQAPAKYAKAIARDLGSDSFLVQHPDDFQEAARQWMLLEDNTFSQGDMSGSPLAMLCTLPFIPQIVNPGSRKDRFGYVNDLGEVSGFSFNLYYHPNNPHGTYAWAISIMHDATGNTQERTVHVITNLPYSVKEDYPLLKSKKISRRGVLSFIKEHLVSEALYPVIQSILQEIFRDSDAVLGNPEHRDEVFTPVMLANGYTHEGMNWLSPEAVAHKKPEQYSEEGTAAKAAAKQRSQEIPESEVFSRKPHIEIEGIEKLRTSVYNLYSFAKRLPLKDKAESDTALNLAKELNHLAKLIAKSKTEVEFNINQQNFEDAYKNGKTVLAKYKSKAKMTVFKALGFVATALFNLGVLEVATKHQSKSKRGLIEKRLSFFTKTKAERLNKSIANEVRKLKFK